MGKAVAFNRKGIVAIAVLVMLALFAGIVLATGDDTEVVREGKSSATSSSVPSDNSNSSGALSTSRTPDPVVEPPVPAEPEPAIPRTDPATGADGTCDPGGPEAGPGQRQVLVFFHCEVPDQEIGRNVAPVPRLVADSPAVLESSLSELLAGPSESERAAGFYSPFSEATSGFLRGVAIDDGRARIDFVDKFRQIDNVGTTNVSGQIYQELNRTVFQFDTVTAIVYSLNGSAEAWCELHGAECGEVRRQK